jgi:hypothetical protein
MKSEYSFMQNEVSTGHIQFTQKFSTSTHIQNFTKTYEHYSYSKICICDTQDVVFLGLHSRAA